MGVVLTPEMLANRRLPNGQVAASVSGGSTNDAYSDQNYNPNAYTIPSGGTGTGVTKAQTDPLLASLASLADILTNKNNQSQDEYNKAISGYNEQDVLDKENYDKNVFTNENTLTSNNQAALLNAANGATGLRSVLSGLGGLAGSGVDVIKHLVGLAANSDTGAARQTFDTNAGSLTSAWSQAEKDQRQRRADADATLANNKQNNESSVLTSKQSIYEQLANLFGSGTSKGNNYASQATALAAPIAATTKATVAPYAKASASFSPGALKDYLAGTQNLGVNTSGSDTTPINSPAYTSTNKKDTLSGVA